MSKQELLNLTVSEAQVKANDEVDFNWSSVVKPCPIGPR